MRPNIRIPQGALLQLDQMFGLHPAMAPLKPFYDAGTFGVVHAAGQPQPNRSHFEAMEEIERAAPGTSLRTGWIDRVLGGRRRGRRSRGCRSGAGCRRRRSGGRRRSSRSTRWTRSGWMRRGTRTSCSRWDAALRGLHTGAPDLLLAAGDVTLDALATMQTLKDAGYTPANGAVYPDTDLGRGVQRPRAADQGRRRAPDGGHRLRRLGHARGHGRRGLRVAARPAHRAVGGARGVRDRPRDRRHERRHARDADGVRAVRRGERLGRRRPRVRPGGAAARRRCRGRPGARRMAGSGAAT